MISVDQFEDEHNLLKQNAGSEQSRFSQVPLRGINVPLYQFGHQLTGNNGSYGGLSYTAEEEQSLLDSLILAQWEDRAWRGLVQYDVTTCETKIIGGRIKFVAQLNEGWKLNHFAEVEENKVFQQLEPFKFDCMKVHKEELLLCIENGEKANSQLIPSSAVPTNGNLIIINVYPVEYGHIFLVPHSSHHLSRFLDVGSLEMVTQVAVEINNCSFRVFYDCPTSSSANHLYFQACYFASPLPVELRSVVPIFGDWKERGIQICEVADYPIKALLFKSKENSKLLAEVISEICSCLQDQNMPFNLLITNYGKKIFFFPQVLTLATGCNLSAWECGGHFVFKERSDFDRSTEDALLKRLAAVSLDEKGFQVVKQLCCSIASKQLVF
eukprot:TRINITY_DN10813_c0_g1_i1.p1 TRINITY_DN10813_c0_g1~~TRINITY_DN10813_c0_g1_i1.p1  ORF type:complete len:383 (-),score=59.95 TRINITY_DN10813_c0_g1_i1:133-1281(-)